MKKLLIIGLLLAACARSGRTYIGTAGSSCSVYPTETGAIIACTDGTTAVISNGTNGTNGENGSNGQNGASAYDLWLEAGNEGSVSDFLSSLVGPQGQIGETGANGTSCGVTQLANGALITCGANSAVVLNGLNGTDGVDGQDGEDGEDGEDALSGLIGIKEILSPCGNTDAHHEVLLRLSNDSVLALYDGGPNLDRFSLLIPNLTYTTTDSHNNQCVFSINAQGQLN